MKQFMVIALLALVMLFTCQFVHAENYKFKSQWGDSRVLLPNGDLFNRGRGIALDSSGNVYVSNTNKVIKYDSYGNIIRMFTTCNGSSITWPQGLAVDSRNRLYVAEEGGLRVSVYNTVSGACIKTIDGFTTPLGVAVDASYNVYVADFGANTVQKFDPLGNLTATWTGFNRPWGLAIDNDYIYVAEAFGHRINKLDHQGNLITQWGSQGIGDDQFYIPLGMALYNNSIYIADCENMRIKVHDTNGNFLSKFGERGTGNGQMQFPLGVAIDKVQGTVYVAEGDNDRVSKYDINGNFLAQWGCDSTGSTGLRYPTKVAVDDKNNVFYVVDSGNHRIIKLSSGMQILTTWGGYGGGDGQFQFPYSAVVDSKGSVYVVDNAGRSVQKFSAAGAFIKKWIVNGNNAYPQTTLYGLHGIAVDMNDNIYVADAGTAKLFKFDSNGSQLSAWSVPPYTTGVDVDKVNGFIYIVHWLQQIMKLDMNGNLIKEFASPGNNYQLLLDLSVDVSGNIFAMYQGTQTLVKFDPDGKIIAQYTNNNIWTPSAQPGQFAYPYGVSVDHNGYVYIADTENHRIQVFQAVASSKSVLNLRSGKGYSNITAAYQEAQDGDVILCQAVAFSENIEFNRTPGILVTLKGGYDGNFKDNSAGTTKIEGKLTLARGTVIIEKITMSSN